MRSIVISLNRPLDRAHYQFYMRTAQEQYDQGARNLLLNSQGLESIDLAGLFALHNLAHLFWNRPMIKADCGLRGFRTLVNENLHRGLHTRVMILDPPPHIERYLIANRIDQVIPFASAQRICQLNQEWFPAFAGTKQAPMPACGFRSARSVNNL